jgi:hypothetical protein
MEVEKFSYQGIDYFVGQKVYCGITYAEVQFLYDDGYAQIKYDNRVRLVKLDLLEVCN